MRKPAAALVLTALVLLTLHPAAFACGDKFLLTGPGVQYLDADGEPYQASILLFANPNSAAGPVLKDAELWYSLQTAGHNFDEALDLKALVSLLGENTYDIVMVDIEDVDQVQTEIASAGSTAVVLPVLVDPSSTEMKQARASYQAVLKVPSPERKLLAMIDDVMTRHLKSVS
jgi:hypothetical protein